MADTSSLLSNLSISLQQKSVHPALVGITVTNNNAVPVTFLKWDSPLDPLVLQLGALSITFTPSSSSGISSSAQVEELDIPQIKVARRAPPGDESLVELDAGAASEENAVELKDVMVGKPLRELGGGGDGKVTVKCKGRWRAVWAEKKAGLGEERRKLMGADDDAVSGEFESEAVEMTVE